jgi:cell division transport system permease protein
MSALAKTAYFWRSAAQGIRHAPFVHAIAVLTIAIALFTAGLVRSAARLLDGLTTSLSSQVELTVYLARGTEPAFAQELAQAMASRAQGSARVVSPDEALHRLASELGEVGRSLQDLPENPLPPTIEVEVPVAQRDTAALRELVEKTRAVPQVTSVDFAQDAIERLAAITRALRMGGLFAFIVVVIATVVIVSATLQLAIYSRRQEIEIQKLVGATNRFVKVPFLLEGLLQGLLGAAVAGAGLWAFSVLAGPTLTAVFAFLAAGAVKPVLVDPRLFLELAAVGAALGLCGSFVAVGRFLKV